MQTLQTVMILHTSPDICNAADTLHRCNRRDIFIKLSPTQLENNYFLQPKREWGQGQSFYNILHIFSIDNLKFCYSFLHTMCHLNYFLAIANNLKVIYLQLHNRILYLNNVTKLYLLSIQKQDIICLSLSSFTEDEKF